MKAKNKISSRIISIALFLAVGIASNPVTAGAFSWPAHQHVLNVAIAGVELCPQSLCGAAVFLGKAKGQVDRNSSASGLFWAAVNHEPLPTAVGESSMLLPNGDRDVDWALWIFPFHTGKIDGGTLTCVEIDPLQGGACVVFTLEADLSINGGGSACFQGFLDHRPLFQDPPRPPTVQGTLSTSCE